MRRRLVWIQGGTVYSLSYGFNRGGVFPNVSINNVNGLIQLTNPAPPFDQTFNVTNSPGTTSLTILQNTQSTIEVNFPGGVNATVITRSYSANSLLSVDASLRLEQLSSTTNPSLLIFARAFINLARVSPSPSVLETQSIILYGNDPVGTIRTWSGTLTAP